MPTRPTAPQPQTLAPPDAPQADVEVEARAEDAAVGNGRDGDGRSMGNQHPGKPSQPGVPLAPPGIAPESDVRVHTPSSAAPDPSHGQSSDGLGELPRGYDDGRLVALVRDPETLFIYWDFSAWQIEQAFAGLGAAKATLKLWNTRGPGADLVRESDVHLEARGWYLRELPPGLEVRVEIWAVGERGARLLRAARPVRLPAASPSDQLEAVYLTLSLDQSLRDGLTRASPLNYGGAAPVEWDRRLHPRVVAESSPAGGPPGAFNGGPGALSPSGKLPWSMTHLVPDLDKSS
jgi:hypothetical protein